MLHAGAAAQDVAPLLDTDAVQAVLRPDEIVFAFTLAEPHSFRWVISREYLVFDRIAGRKAIEKEAARLSTTLAAMLFDKISTADDRPLIVVRDGILHRGAVRTADLAGSDRGRQAPRNLRAITGCLREVPPCRNGKSEKARANPLIARSSLVRRPFSQFPA